MDTIRNASNSKIKEYTELPEGFEVINEYNELPAGFSIIEGYDDLPAGFTLEEDKRKEISPQKS